MAFWHKTMDAAKPLPARRIALTLRSVVLSTLAIGSAQLLWWHWSPWYEVCKVPLSDYTRIPPKMSHHGTHVITGTTEGIAVWSTETGDRLFTLKEVEMPIAVGLSEHDEYLVGISSEGRAYLYYYGKGQLLAELVINGERGHFSRGGITNRQTVVAVQGPKTHHWELPTGKYLPNVDVSEDDIAAIKKSTRSGISYVNLYGYVIEVIDFSSNGTRVITAFSSQEISVYQNRRPEFWWGLAWLPSFWLTIAFTCLLGINMWRDAVCVKKGRVA